MVYRNCGRNSNRYMAGRNDHIGNLDRQLIIGLQSCSSDSDCYLSHMWDLYNGMVSDRISQQEVLSIIKEIFRLRMLLDEALLLCEGGQISKK